MPTPIKKPRLQSDADDLRVMPQPQKSDHKMVVLGDLHGNALKLLHFLIKQGVVTTTQEKYEQFYQDYHEDPPTKAAVVRIAQFISNLVVNRSNPSLLFIGDELADRGSNDFFTLLLFNKLHEKKVPYAVLPSNHGAEFDLSHDNVKREQNLDRYLPRLLDNQGRSMKNLMHIMKEGWVDFPTIDALVQTHRNHQRLLHYSLNDTGITLYSHAPVDFRIIEGLAKKFNVPYLDATPVQLAFTIEKINQAYMMAVNQPGGLSKLINNNALDALASKTGYTNNDIIHFPLEYIVWNRNYTQTMQFPIHPTHHYSISYVHGHDSSNPHHPPHVTCLDSAFGKAARQEYQQCNTWMGEHGQVALVTANPILHDSGLIITPQEITHLENSIRIQNQPAATATEAAPHTANQTPSGSAFITKFQEILPPTRKNKDKEKTPEQNEQMLLAKYPGLKEFKKNLNFIVAIGSDLLTKHLTNDATAVSKLHTKLTSQYRQLTIDPQQTQPFYDSCMEAIIETKEALTKHRSGQSVLNNIILAIEPCSTDIEDKNNLKQPF